MTLSGPLPQSPVVHEPQWPLHKSHLAESEPQSPFTAARNGPSGHQEDIELTVKRSSAKSAGSTPNSDTTDDADASPRPLSRAIGISTPTSKEANASTAIEEEANLDPEYVVDKLAGHNAVNPAAPGSEAQAPNLTRPPTIVTRPRAQLSDAQKCLRSPFKRRRRRSDVGTRIPAPSDAAESPPVAEKHDGRQTRNESRCDGQVRPGVQAISDTNQDRFSANATLSINAPMIDDDNESRQQLPEVSEQLKRRPSATQSDEIDKARQKSDRPTSTVVAASEPSQQSTLLDQQIDAEPETQATIPHAVDQQLPLVDVPVPPTEDVSPRHWQLFKHCSIRVSALGDNDNYCLIQQRELYPIRNTLMGSIYSTYAALTGVPTGDVGELWMRFERVSDIAATSIRYHDVAAYQGVMAE